MTSANSKKLPANRARKGVQSLYTFPKLKHDLLLRHDPKSKENSTRGIAKSYSVTCGTIGRILHGIEPHNAAIREKLGLPPLGLGVLCKVHGRVCSVQHRPPKPASERVCCNSKCGWHGDESECVHPHHWPEDRLCPECYEVTEEVKRKPRPGWGRKPLNTVWPVNTSEW